MQRKIAAIPVTMLTNLMENINDRLQECINVKERYLPGVIFHDYLLPILQRKLLIFSYKLYFISHFNISQII